MITFNRHSILTLNLLFLLVAPSRSSSPSSDLPKAVISLDGQRERIEYVQQSLCQRLNYVKNGKRSNDIRQWVRSRGGEPKIFSMHGVDVNFEIDELENLELEFDIYPLVKQRKDDPFLPDRMNLNFHHDSNRPIAFYKGDTTFLHDKPPTSLELCVRAVRLSLNFGPVLSAASLAILSKKFRNKIWYPWLASCLGSSGAAFIKWGQWASTRSDMFPDALCAALSNLHNDAPHHSWNFTQTEVEASLDIPQGSMFEVFDRFDPEPMASGSIAQVHKATLRNGMVVAAKVRHPSVSRLIEMDFRLMEIVTKLLDWIPGFKWLHVKDSVSQFSHTMAAQAHLNVEAHHLEVLNHNFDSWGHVQFPRPFFASPCLILETFEEGRIVTDVLDQFDCQAESMENSSFQGFELVPLEMAKFMVTTGVALYLKMLLIDNIMHADLHPGNIMLDVLDSGKGDNAPSKFRIALVDAGMVAQLTEEEGQRFIGLLTALGEGDGRAAAEFALQFSIENDISDEEMEKFKEEMCELFDKICKGYFSNVDVGEVLRGVLGLIRDHRVRIDANYATLVINLLCVESLARRICPTYNVLDASRPLLQTYRRICYQEDGFTPKSKDSYHKTIKKLLPLMLHGKKKREDNAFFRRIELQRKASAISMS